MQLEDYFDSFPREDIRIRGTRVGLETVLYDSIHRARTPEQNRRQLPLADAGTGPRHDRLLLARP